MATIWTTSSSKIISYASIPGSERKEGKKWTHTYPNGAKAQLDYVLMNNKWKNSALDCEAFNSMENLESDHRLVTARLRLSLRANRVSRAKIQPHDWTALTYSREIREQYIIETRNRFEALNSEKIDHDPNTLYNNFVQANAEAATAILPKKPRSRRMTPWMTDEIIQKRNELRSVKKSQNNNPTNQNTANYERAKGELINAYNNEQQRYIDEKLEELKRTNPNSEAAVAWKIANEITGRKTTNRAKLRAKNDAERVGLWKQHFQKLLGAPPKISDKPTKQISPPATDIKQGVFTLNEIEQAIKSLPNRKAAGLDNIPCEVWKTGAFNSELLSFCNKVYNQHHIDAWNKSCILPFPKKGDLGLAKNYRGISLIPIAAKIYNRLLLNRIRPHVERILRPNQNGFRQKRSTVGQILTVKRIIEEVKAYNLPATLLFVDFSKAFDSIHRGKMKEILLAYGIPTETVNAIMMLYRNTQATVRSPDGDTSFFEISGGVLQGDTLAPYLFIICLDYVLRVAIEDKQQLGFTISKAQSRRYPAKKITDADYADDIALLSDFVQDAQIILHNLETASKEVGLYLNAKKTEYMCFNQDGDIKTLDGEQIQKVTQFTYLGSNTNTEKDITIRIAKAWKALDKMTKIWKSDLDTNIKRKFFRAAVEPILLYGSATWTLTKKAEAQIDGAYTRMLRAALNLSWQQHPTILQLYGKNPRVSTTIKERRLKFAGHCWRHKEELASQVLLWKPTHGRRGVGRPCKTYRDQITEDCNLYPDEMKRAMEDRKEWRARIDEIRGNTTR